ncbi:hypothetical protein [Roseateles albus]|uniref:DUF3828 domain-containing protein n=1 Tax=Roseateles albus TaxID=2987525 RepID=A0ABT5KCQ4_9BURK|nr:hypothetical protein [Roseateles albus]MDC8771716.1 hypothetical protein [Roseateles albus]
MPHFTIFLLLLFLGLPVAAVGECLRSPSSSALALYEKHQDFIFTGAPSPPLGEALANAVEANLAEQRRTGSSGFIDWNYWTDAQDGEQSRSAKVTFAKVKGAQAQVRISYYFLLGPGEKQMLKQAVVQLSRTHHGCWLVEDVLRGQRSVMSYLERN